MIRNTVIKNNRTSYIYNKKNKIYDKLIDDVKNNKKIFVVCTYKNESNNIKSMLLEKTQINKDKILLYTADEDDDIKDGLLNINEVWGEAQVIIISPLVTVGNSYTLKDVDNVYIFAGPGSCCVRDTFQGHMRVRHNMGDLHVYLEEEKTQIFNDKYVNYESYKIIIWN